MGGVRNSGGGIGGIRGGIGEKEAEERARKMLNKDLLEVFDLYATSGTSQKENRRKDDGEELEL